MHGVHGCRGYPAAGPNVDRMYQLGARVVAVESGDRTLRAAIDEAFRNWVADPEGSYYLLGRPLARILIPTWFSVCSRSLAPRRGPRCSNQTGSLPDVAVACVGGGSNAIGLFHPLLADSSIELLGVEAGGNGPALGENSATLATGKPGVLHGSYSVLLTTPTDRSRIRTRYRRGSITQALGPSIRC